ncbi:MAG: PEGA domain-containing protein [Sandaracinaceae bacterium]
MMRWCLLWTWLVSASLPGLLFAQAEGTEAAETTDDPSAEEAPPAAAPTAAPAAPTEPRARTDGRPAYAPATPLPIMVAALPGRRVEEEYATAAQTAVVEQIRPFAGERPVLGLGLASLREALAACEEDECLGQQLSQARAQAAVLVRLDRRGNRIEASLEVREPISGALRGEPIEGRLPRDQDGMPEALVELTNQLPSQLPDPPPPPGLLTVAVNVDGAIVQGDGEEIGTAPVAPVEVGVGEHQVSVRAAGFRPERRRARLGAGERGRGNVNLTPTDPNAVVTLSDEGELIVQESSGTRFIDTPWFWVVIGAAVVVVAAAIAIPIAVANSGGGNQPPPLPMGIPLPSITGNM